MSGDTGLTYVADGLLIPPPAAAFTTPAYDSALGNDTVLRLFIGLLTRTSWVSLVGCVAQR